MSVGAAAGIRETFGELADLRRWVAWRTEERNGKPTKVPYSPTTARRADSTDPSTWGTLEDAEYLRDERGLDGVGVVLGDVPELGVRLGGVDLDACRDPATGEVTAWARRVVEGFRSYTEISPSETGLKLLAYGAPETVPCSEIPMPTPPIRGKEAEIAVYPSGRYFCVTGRVLDDVPDEIVDAGEAGGAWDRMVRLLADHAAKKNGDGPERATVAPTGATKIPEGLRQVLDGHTKAGKLWREGKDGGGDRSVNDAALAATLGAMGFDHAEIEAAIRAYPLGQVGQGALQGRAADRQVSRLLGMAATARNGTDPADPSGEGEPPTPLFVPEEIRFGRFLEAEAPERRWVWKEVLPEGIVGLLVSGGGAGKSILVYQFGISVATGTPFLGMEMGEPGGFLYVAAEDDDAELHRRGRILYSHYRQSVDTAGARFDTEAVAQRLHVVSRVAESNRLTTAQGDGEVRQTALVDRLVEAARTIPDLRCIVLDPVSRFRGGEANREEHATVFVETLEAIRQETGATVLALHHSNKAGVRDGGGQEIVRGSSALVDGVRWVATLQRLRKDEAKNYDLHESEAGRYLFLDIPKSNYAPPFPGMWLRREAGGVLVPTELEKVRSRDAKADRDYFEVVERLQGLLREQGPLTRKKISTQYAGLSGVLGAGDKTVRSIIERAVRSGDLLEVPTDGGATLRAPSEDDE